MLNNLKIATLDFLYTDHSVFYTRAELQKKIITEVTKNNADNQILVDVSVIIQSDARTGIQRVVRALLKQLLDNPPKGYVVRPVYASATHNYRYVTENVGLFDTDNSLNAFADKRIVVMYGDIFLGLDLAAHILPKYQSQLEQWKRKGVKIHAVVYDLLPVLHPQWFRSKTTRNFYRWLRSIAILSDSVICISKAVKSDLRRWLVRKYAFTRNTLPVNVIPMGCDIQASLPSSGLPDNVDQLLIEFKSRKTALMVGTLEPRKGHTKVLDSFECLWENGSDVNLLIVGKAGWKTEELQARLRNHPRLYRTLFWLDDVSDEFLEKIYTTSYGLILASEGEGFGLPLIEALQHRKPVLVRDLPVYRELRMDLNYIPRNVNTTKDLAIVLHEWMKHSKVSDRDISTVLRQTWRISANSLTKYLLGFEEKNIIHTPAVETVG